MLHHHLASRLFGVPLLIERHKLDSILAAVGPRLGLELESIERPKSYGPGDKGRERKSYLITEDGIAVIDIMGPLVKRASGDFLSGGPTTYGEISAEFSDAVANKDVAGILLAVDSPGGETVGAFELADLIHGQRGTKPIFASADGDAFSAAYLVASATDRLYVTKSGGVGSVGVWMMHVDQSEANAQKGLKPTYLFAGARKIDGNPHAPLSEEARAAFQAEVDRLYDMFVESVARNRAMKESAVRATEAGLFFGGDGVAIGFADKVGTFADALAGLRAAIARSSGNKNSGVAASAALNPKEEQMEAEKSADAQTSAESKPAEVDTASIRTEALEAAATVAELCYLAGQPRKAAEFIRSGKSRAEVSAELMSARATEDAKTEIHSAVAPDTGAEAGDLRGKANVNDSPIVKAAARRAQAGKEK